MTQRMLNVLRGVGSVISVDGTGVIRNSRKSASRRIESKVLGKNNDRLEGDFRRIGKDLSVSIKRFDRKKLVND